MVRIEIVVELREVMLVSAAAVKEDERPRGLPDGRPLPHRPAAQRGTVGSGQLAETSRYAHCTLTPLAAPTTIRDGLAR
jgi:hypothetical protein